MWCRQCKQDVPVLRSSVGAPACPRCRRALTPPDEGVDLESFDASPPRPATISPWVLEADRFELQRIGRRLRPCARHEAACVLEPTAKPFDQPLPAVTAQHEVEPAAVTAAVRVEAHEPNDDVATGTEAAADCGLLVTLAGIVTMAIQGEGFIAEEFWRWGFIAAVVGGTTFAVGVLRLATGASQRYGELKRELEQLRGEVATRRAVMVDHDAHGPFEVRSVRMTTTRSPRFEEPGAKLRVA